ncbi:hypothetical protein HDV00_003989 [Rhizophlyctis rosea]|nr:hypothetical protein HDV00_003989 [Rhizophlyctis rosea]
MSRNQEGRASDKAIGTERGRDRDAWDELKQRSGKDILNFVGSAGTGNGSAGGNMNDFALGKRRNSSPFDSLKSGTQAVSSLAQGLSAGLGNVAQQAFAKASALGQGLAASAGYGTQHKGNGAVANVEPLSSSIETPSTMEHMYRVISADGTNSTESISDLPFPAPSEPIPTTNPTTTIPTNIYALSPPPTTPPPLSKSLSCPMAIPSSHSAYQNHLPASPYSTSPNSSTPSTPTTPEPIRHSVTITAPSHDPPAPPPTTTTQHAHHYRSHSNSHPPRDPTIGIPRRVSTISVHTRSATSATFPSRIRHRSSSITSASSSSPVTSASYSSLPQSPAVSFLAMLADRTSSGNLLEGVGSGDAVGDGRSSVSSVGGSTGLGEYGEGDQVGSYILGREIGRGTFSVVFEGVYVGDAEVGGLDGPIVTTTSKEKVALKIVMRKNGPEDVSGVESLQHESRVWARVNGLAGVLEMRDVMDTGDAVVIVSELCEGGTLLDLLQRASRSKHSHDTWGGDGKGSGVPLHVVRSLVRGICRAVKGMHDRGVVHGDLKLENLVLKRRGELEGEDRWEGDVRVGDFGFGRVVGGDGMDGGGGGSGNEGVMGSLHYLAPELLRPSSSLSLSPTVPTSPLPTFASDAYAIGVIFYALIVGTLPFDDDFQPRLVRRILGGGWARERVAEVVGCGDEGRRVVEVLEGLLCGSVEGRWGLERVLEVL